MLEKVDKKYDPRRFLDIFVIRIDPNKITTLALIVAIIAGYFFYSGNILLAAIFVLLNGFLDVLDGRIAKKYGTTKFGDFLDHTVDRLADVAILVGIALSEFVPVELGFAALVSLLLVSYLGTQSQAITHKRVYSGMVGRADRLVIISIASILNIFYGKALYYGIWLILILSIFTFIQRFLICKNTIKSS
ncbi:MAG: CDP-alcohol phosphatidyltransferase family protein [Candidatus Woesearchaeota archaeon]|nr:MAG: CDP-alcohol phosphatidyltransferase family protein [Candidatus Woesearchaeota archaeon]